MEGYIRDPATTERLLAELRAAMWRNPTQRLGQLLVNITRANEDLFYLWDEVLIELLQHS